MSYNYVEYTLVWWTTEKDVKAFNTFYNNMHIYFCTVLLLEWQIMCDWYADILNSFPLIVTRLSKSLATLTLGSSKINQHRWRFHGSGVIEAPQIIGLISFCTGMHHEYFFEVVNVLSCSPFMFKNTENKQLIDG